MYKFASLTLIVLLAVVVAGGWTMTPNPTPEKVLDKNMAKLVAALQHENLEKRAAAAEKLGEKCCQDAVPYLVKMMKEDEVASARIVAANALAKIGDKSVIPDMVEQAKNDKNKTVRYTLAVLAEELNKKKTATAS